MDLGYALPGKGAAPDEIGPCAGMTAQSTGSLASNQPIDRIYRDHRFASFRDAVAFVVAVADVAEAQRHHPNILLHEWCFVRLELYSHLRGTLTQADVDLAVALNALPAA